MTSELDTTPSRGDRERSRAYVRDVVPAMGGYVVVVTAVTAWGHLDGTSPWRFAWALLPLLPAALIVRAVVRFLARSDEYARLVQLTSLAVAFAATMLACVVLGMLAIAGGPLPAVLLPWLAFGVGMLAWGVAAGVVTHR
jgi:hypothetical protein